MASDRGRGPAAWPPTAAAAPATSRGRHHHAIDKNHAPPATSPPASSPSALRLPDRTLGKERGRQYAAVSEGRGHSYPCGSDPPHRHRPLPPPDHPIQPLLHIVLVMRLQRHSLVKYVLRPIHVVPVPRIHLVPDDRKVVMPERIQQVPTNPPPPVRHILLGLLVRHKLRQTNAGPVQPQRHRVLHHVHSIPGRQLRLPYDLVRPRLHLRLIMTRQRRKLRLIRILIMRIAPVAPHRRQMLTPRRVHQVKLDRIRVRRPRPTRPTLRPRHRLPRLPQRHVYPLPLVRVRNHPRRQQWLLLLACKQSAGRPAISAPALQQRRLRILRRHRHQSHDASRRFTT